MKLKFKKEGWFLDACSARYKAIVNDDVYVTVEAFMIRDYGISWYIRFNSKNVSIGVDLDDKLNRYIDPVNTKRFAIEVANDVVENNEYFKIK